jgi:hypothetical protein
VPASDAIWASWLEALVRQSSPAGEGLVARPRVDAEAGDLVLVNERPVVVGLSPGPLVRTRSAWERDLLTLRACERDGALRWGDRAAARAALHRAVAEHGHPATRDAAAGELTA